jgi:tetratricopeptide (TPR) repeat protein
MAEVYTKKGDKELAMNNYLTAVTLFETYEAYEDMGIYAAKALKEVDSTNIQMEKFLMYHYIKMNDHRMALAIGLDIDAHCIAQNNAKDGYANMVFMAMSLYELEAYEEAISVMEDAALDKTTARDYGYLIYCYVSACYRKLGENEKADDCLKSAMEMDTKAEEYINSLLDR